LKWQDAGVDIACSLSPGALACRHERWRRLIAGFGLTRELDAGGVRLRFRSDPAALAALHAMFADAQATVSSATSA
jgi:hypothetical protein